VSLRNEIATDLERMEYDVRGPDDQPQTLVYGDLTVPCIPTSVSTSTVLDEEGNIQRLSASVFVRLEHFNLLGESSDEAGNTESLFSASNPVPICGRVVRFRWQYLRVVNVQLMSTQSHIRLDLSDSGSNQ